MMVSVGSPVVHLASAVLCILKLTSKMGQIEKNTRTNLCFILYFIYLNQPEKEDKKAEKVDFRRLGEEFCHWFFELLNSQNPFLGPPQDEWGPQHFWHDVKLRFYYNTSEQNVIDYCGAEIVSLRLLSLVKEEYLFLSPNLDASGLKCASSPHGLVMVGVAGTVHRGNTCLGIFEQIFGLMHCPVLENTWKIKFINLKIIGEGSVALGTLMKPAVNLNIVT